MPVIWHKALDEVPDGPSIIVANEFFDALPVNQAVKLDNGWHERWSGSATTARLAFTLAREPIPLFPQLLPPAHARSADRLDLRMARRQSPPWSSAAASPATAAPRW